MRRWLKRNKWIQVLFVVSVILLPIAWWWIRDVSTTPRVLRIATGPGRGLYEQIAMSIVRRVRAELPDIRISTVSTGGSLENLRLLQEGEVDFALYQTGTLHFLGGPCAAFRRLDSSTAAAAGDPPHPPPCLEDGSGDDYLDLDEFASGRDRAWAELAFRKLDTSVDGFLDYEEYTATATVEAVANIHYEVANVFLKSADAARVHRIAVGGPMSGDRAMSQFLIESLGRPQLEQTQLSYPGLRDALENGELDGAIVTAGVRAPILRDLAAVDEIELWNNPIAGALTTANPLLTEYTIHTGMYGIDPALPAQDISTVALKSQLLTRERVSPRLVETVTRIVLSKDFVQENQLKELFEQGEAFAKNGLEFETHLGAMRVYDPDFHPLLPTDLVESTEGIRSFIFSCIIAGFFGFQWWRRRRAMQSEHRLDSYIRSLLEIERRQIDLDAEETRDDLATLQVLLDEVTHLRQDALREISAHELNEERGVACFIDMTHELSQKINAKIARQRLDRQLGRLIDVIDKQSSVAEESQS